MRTSVRAPGVRSMTAAHRLEIGLLQARQQADPLAERLLEVESPAMAASVTAATSAPQPPSLGEQVDHLALQEGRVRVHDDEMLGPAMQAGGLHCDVDLA